MDSGKTHKTPSIGVQGTDKCDYTLSESGNMWFLIVSVPWVNKAYLLSLYVGSLSESGYVLNC